MANEKLKRKSQIIYISHGGGPLPILKEESHKKMIVFMKELSQKLHKPELIIVFSAHWEENLVSITGDEKPSLLYDYYGFPKESYEITYNAPGSPNEVKNIKNILENNSIKSNIIYDRGFDHGLFIPLKLIYPDADIPCIQISLIKGLSPKDHLNLGKALKPLLNQNILIIGSGFSFHNLSDFSFNSNNVVNSKNEAFQDWLIDTCTNENYSNENRQEKLENWENAPHSRYCHPREEHLLPIHICQGIATTPAKLIFNDYIAGKKSIALSW